MILMIELSGKGGIWHYTYNLCRKLSQTSPLILVTSQDYELIGINNGSLVIEKIFNRFKTRPKMIFKLLRLAKEARVRVIHFQLSQHPEFVLFLILLFKLFSSKKIVVTAHNVVDHEEKLYLRGIFKVIYRMADLIIVHAQSAKKELMGFAEISQEKVSVIPHGNYLFFTEGSAQVTQKKPCVNEMKYILFYGFIRKYKGLLYLLRALGRVRESISNVKLMIVGKPIGDFKPYQDEIMKLSLEGNVILDLGYADLKKTQSYFNRADVVVMPYEKIYQSGVLQVAYAFGKPVVVTDSGGMPEAVEEGKSGYIVPVADTAGLSEAIIKILSDDKLREEMGRRAQELAKTSFSWENIARQTHFSYQNLNTGMRIPVLMYHDVSINGRTHNKYALGIGNLKQHLDYLKENGFIPLSEEWLCNPAAVFSDKRVVLTFDDSYANYYKEVLPLLNQYGFKAIFFLTTGLLGKEKQYLSWEQVIEMKKQGMSIQAHTHTHRFLDDLTQEQIRKELSESKSSIENKLGSKVNFFSCPGGRFTQEALKIAGELGYKGMFTSIPGYCHPTKNNLVVFRRFLLTAASSPREFMRTVNLNANLLSKKAVYYAKFILKKSLGNKLYYSIWERTVKNES